MNMDYKEFKQKRIDLSEIVSKQSKVVKEANYDEVVKISNKPSLELEEIATRLKDDQLRVLVMGRFSSGKSTFLNALLGEVILPAKATPTTAVISEICYANEGKITLIPKNGEVPFTIRKDELNKYIIIDNTSNESIESPYKKMLLDWPLQICERGGISFVDSPGLDDPNSHDDITKDYLPKADAIVYCMPSTNAYSQKDKQTIEELRSLGYESIIFVLTYFDILKNNDIVMGGTEANELKDYMYKTLCPLTNLGRDGIFFVDSLSAILGKKNNDQVKLNDSNFPLLEQRLEDILVNQKGRLKLSKSLYSTKKINRSVGRYMHDAVVLSTKNELDLQQMVKDAKVPLDRAKCKSELINRQVQQTVEDIISNTSAKGDLFYLNCVSKIDNWINTHTPEEGINPIHLKLSVTKYTQSCVDHLKVEMEKATQSWCNSEIVPYIKKRFENMLSSMESDVEEYAKDIQRVRVNLELPIDVNPIADKKVASPAERTLAAIAGVCIGDFAGAILGGALGFGGMLKTLTAELTAGIILGIVSMFTPIGLPTVIIGAIIAVFAGGGWQIMSIKSTIKKKIIEESKKQMNAKKNDFSKALKNEIEKSLVNIKKGISDGLNSSINECQKLIDDANANAQDNEQNIQNKKIIYQRLIVSNNTIATDLDDFAEGM